MKKKTILATIAVYSVLSLVFILIAIFLSMPNGESVVYITNTGECYHQGRCHTLRHSKIATTLEDAFNDGYRQCGICVPPRLKTGESLYDTNAEKIAAFFNIIPSMGLGTIMSGGICLPFIEALDPKGASFKCLFVGFGVLVLCAAIIVFCIL